MTQPKSQDYLDGFTQAMVFLSDIFESHSDAFMKKGILRKKDVRLVVSVIDACIRRREVLADIGPRNMNLFIRKDGRVDLKEK